MRFVWILLVPLMVGVAAPAQAQHRTMEHPRVSMEAARKTALDRVPHSTVAKEEIRHMNGKPVYEFDLKVAGKEGYEMVKVDGMTGHVMSVRHETAHRASKPKKH